MAELFLNKCMEKAQTESNLSITNTNNDMNIKLSKEFLTELQNNAYYGIHHEDVVDHIAMVLEMLDLIDIPVIDSHQLRMKVFPLSLADDARQWWINEGEGRITTWEELVEKFFYKFYPESYDGEEEMLDKGNNWGVDPLEFISWPYLKTQEKNNTRKDDERIQTKRKCKDANLEANNTSNTLNNERPNKRMCNSERIEAIKYSPRPNEVYIDIRRCENDTWERNNDTMS
ncbi:hypothetical protein Tco_0763291 [Tanacetum coccineum]